MKKFIPIIIFNILINLFFLSFTWAATTVKVDVLHSQDRYQAGGKYPIILHLKISSPWYIHSLKKDASEMLIPTKISFDESSELKVDEVKFPEPVKKKFDYNPEPVEVFSGDILVRATLEISGNAQSGERTIKGNLSYQACSSNSCLPPENSPVTVSVSVAPEGYPSSKLNQEKFPSIEEGKSVVRGRPGAGLWLTLLGIFLGGLALNLTPCIYPLIPITVSYFSGRSNKVRGHALFHGLLYISGLAFTNSMLGLSAALSGGLLGSALQNPFVLIFVAGIMIALGLSFFGLWEFRIPAGLTRIASRSYGGYFGTFFMGLTLGIIAAPCLGPFILGLLTYVGQKGDPFLGFLYFFTLSIGMGLPLSVLAIFSGSIERLPLSGDWMVWVRKFMGWVLIGMAAYMINPLIPSYPGEYGLIAGVIIAAGIHLGWIDRTGRAIRGFSYFRKVMGLILVGGGIIYLVSGGHERDGIKWIPYDQALISRAVKDNKPLILDFSADWCGPCMAMEKRVFRDPEVVKMSRDIITLRVDLTRRQPSQDDVLSLYRVRGVPTIIFLNRKGNEEKRLRIESYVGKSEFLKKIKWLLEKSPPVEK